MKALIYKNHKIVPFSYQGCENFRIFTSSGMAWNEVACNVKTAKRWIDIDIACKPRSSGCVMRARCRE